MDTFFFVSGFLVVYAMLRRFKHDGHGIKVFTVVLKCPLRFVIYLGQLAPNVGNVLGSLLFLSCAFLLSGPSLLFSSLLLSSPTFSPLSAFIFHSRTLS